MAGHPGVAATGHFDAVHRVIGRPGVIFVAEGSPARVKPLLAQEKKRTARLVGDIPIYDIVVGNGEGEVPLSKLERHLTKLPANITVKQMDSLESRLAALGTKVGPAAMPKGPLPTRPRCAACSTVRRVIASSPKPTFGREKCENRHFVDLFANWADYRLTTAVLVKRSCSPRRSVSVISGGITSAISSPRTSARPNRHAVGRRSVPPPARARTGPG